MIASAAEENIFMKQYIVDAFTNKIFGGEAVLFAVSEIQA